MIEHKDSYLLKNRPKSVLRESPTKYVFNMKTNERTTASRNIRKGNTQGTNNSTEVY